MPPSPLKVHRPRSAARRPVLPRRPVRCPVQALPLALLFSLVVVLVQPLLAPAVDCCRRMRRGTEGGHTPAVGRRDNGRGRAARAGVEG